jgi:TonB-dependent starch-binding outer membrane protein SusC
MKKKSSLFSFKEIPLRITQRAIKLIIAVMFIGLLNSFTGVHSQESPASVKGSITDANTGESLIGVSVAIKGTTIGTVADANGKYSIGVADKNAVLVFSYVGYLSQEIAVIGQSTIDVKLAPDIQKLEEVVVVGYGTQSKRTVTGSVASVGYDKFKDRSYSNISQALSGQIAGVNITQSQGAPGSSPIIKIRGTSSLTAGTNPLYVVDGMPMENFNLNNINMQDIESVDVLKDAASAAIYGSRGANGVILITTKNGKPGKTVVSFTYEHGIQSVPRLIDMMDATQFVQYYIDAHNNGWVASAPGRSANDPNSVRASVSGGKYMIPDTFLTNPTQFGKGTDWQDVAFRTAHSNNYQITISGGTENTQFLSSAAYLDQDAVLDNNFYKRLSVRTNIKHKLSKRVTIGTNLAFTGIQDRTDGTLGKVDVVSLALQNSPIFPEYNENGNLGYMDPKSKWYKYASAKDMSLWHPYSMTREIDKLNKTFNTLGTAFLEVDIMEGLKFRSSVNGDLSNSRLNAYQSMYQGYGYGTNSTSNSSLGLASSTYSFNWLTENIVTYEKQIGDHNIKGLLGYTAQKQRDEFSYVTANNYPNDKVHSINGGTVNGGTSIPSEWAMLSYLGRINYSYLNRYFLTGTLRRDGSSRFGPDNKWGYFPSISAGWLASDEAFLKDNALISYLKLKVSYGLSGNNQIPNYGSVGLLSTVNSSIVPNYATTGGAGSNYVFNSNVATGLLTTNLPNPGLRWEKTSQLNAGIELGLLKNRINLTVEYYSSETKDLLLNLPIPDITGFSTQLTNIGKLENKGVELNLNTRNVVGEFTWTTDFNLSMNRNKILQLGPGNAPIYFNSFSSVKNEVGQPMNNFYGFKLEGVFKTQAEIDAYPLKFGGNVVKPGDPKYADFVKDSIINDKDKTIIGNAQPDFIAGMTNTFTYKGIEFSFMLQGSFGGEIVNEQVRYNGVWNGGRNAYAEAANYWKSEAEPGDGTHFRPTVDNVANQGAFSSYWVSDATFVRVKNIRLSYTLPSAWLSRFSIQTTRIYINIENAFLFCDYKTGYDPENSTYNATTYSATSNLGVGAPGAANTVLAGGYNNNTSNPATPSGAFAGVDYGSYPVPRTITIGVKLDF